MNDEYKTVNEVIEQLAQLPCQDDPLCVIAGTDPDDLASSENGIDGSGVTGIVLDYAGNKASLVMSDRGTMTVEDVVSKLKGLAGDKPLVLEIGYERYPHNALCDADGVVVKPRHVLDCEVLDGDELWNVLLEP